MGHCNHCGKKIEGMPFQCRRCDGKFCEIHHLPENHDCAYIHVRPVSGLKPENTQWHKERHTGRKTSPANPFPVKNKKSQLLFGLGIIGFLILLWFFLLTPGIIYPNQGSLGKVSPNLIPTVLTVSVYQKQSAVTSSNYQITLVPTNPSVSYNDIERAVFTFTNQERGRNRLSALAWDDALAKIARDHSKDMAANNFFSHENLAGEDPTDRATRHGYSTRKNLGGGWYSDGIAENIGKMPTGNVIGHGYVSNNAQSVAKAQVESWMDSPGHRSNILNSGYDRLGVGVAFDGSYYYITQDFF